MRYHALEKLINLREGYLRSFRIDELSLLLIEQGGERHLIEGGCPHQGHPLDTATVAGGVIECPRHHYRFNLDSGELLATDGQRCRPLRVFELVYRGAEVGVLLIDIDD
jgi:nitrite reductase/ring-hydroxylating ferredoxin subunit